MLKRFRQFIESVVFAGLKPGARAPGGQKGAQRLGSLRGLLERFLSRPAPSDPLYLSNRTLDQRVKRGLVIAVPCLILAGGVLLLLSNYFRASAPGPAPEPTGAELAARLLPNLDKTIQIQANNDVQVEDAHIEHEGGVKVVGTVTNNTDHLIRTAEIILNLTDQVGSHLGAVSAQVDNLAPKATVKFQLPIQAATAAFALVREVHAQ